MVFCRAVARTTLVIAIAVIGTGSFAATLSSYERASFSTVTSDGAMQTEDYDSYTEGDVPTTDGVTYEASQGQVYVTDDYLASTAPNGIGSTSLGFFGADETITLSFGQTVNAFSIDVNTFATSDGDYSATFSNGDVVNSTYAPFPNTYCDGCDDFSTGEFIGYTSNAGFDSVTVQSKSGFAYSLDTLEYGTLEVGSNIDFSEESGTFSTDDPWDKSFDWSVSDNTLTFNVDIKLEGDISGVLEELEDGRTYAEVWKEGIETIWSEGAELILDNDQIYDFEFNVDFLVNGEGDYTVTVWDEYFNANGDPRPNMLNWSLALNYCNNNIFFPDECLGWEQSDHDRFAAHEFGHMIGIFDEYVGAFYPGLDSLGEAKLCNNETPEVEDWCNSLMGDLGPIQERYYLTLLENIGLTDQYDLSLSMAPSGYYDFGPSRTISPEGDHGAAHGVSPVPLPASALLLLGGIAGLAGLRRSKRT